jgi:hypothetical protein
MALVKVFEQIHIWDIIIGNLLVSSDFSQTPELGLGVGPPLQGALHEPFDLLVTGGTVDEPSFVPQVVQYGTFILPRPIQAFNQDNFMMGLELYGIGKGVRNGATVEGKGGLPVAFHQGKLRRTQFHIECPGRAAPFHSVRSKFCHQCGLRNVPSIHPWE